MSFIPFRTVSVYGSSRKLTNCSVICISDFDVLYLESAPFLKHFKTDIQPVKGMLIEYNEKKISSFRTICFLFFFFIIIIVLRQKGDDWVDR